MNENTNLENNSVNTEEAVHNEPLKVEASLSEWEEMMVNELSQKFNISDDVILEIGITFIVNEMSAAMNGKPSIINSISPRVENSAAKTDESEAPV